MKPTIIRQIYNFVHWLPLSFLLVYGLWSSYFFPLHDFSNAYFSALFLNQGNFTTEIYDALKFNLALNKQGYSNLFVAFYPNTPFLAFAFIPFSFFNPGTAKLLFNLLSVVLLIFSVFRLKKFFQFHNVLILLLPLLFFTCLRNSLLFGQSYFLIFFLLSECMISFHKKQLIYPAFYTAFALMLKVFPALIILLLMLKNKYKETGFIFLISFFLILFSFFLIDFSAWWFYCSEVLPASAQGLYYDGFTPKAKSITMLFKNLFIYDDLLNRKPFYNSALVYILIQSLFKTLILSLMILFARNKNILFRTNFCFWIIGMMLLSPGWSSYAAVLLLFPLFSIWSVDSLVSLNHKIVFSTLIAFYANVPVAIFLDLPLLFKFPKVFLLLAIFFYYHHLLKNSDKKFRFSSMMLASSLFIVFTVIGMLSDNKQSNLYAINKEEHILISDYFIENGFLKYQYWTDTQPGYVNTEIPVLSSDTSDVKIINKQIFYQDNQITADKSNKRKVMIVNNEILYLCDRNRGMGFYTLMKHKLP